MDNLVGDVYEGHSLESLTRVDEKAQDLCGRGQFHTILIDGIPKLTVDQHNEVTDLPGCLAVSQRRIIQKVELGL